MEPYFYRKGSSVIATGHGAGPWDARMLHGGAPTALIAGLVEDLPSEVPMRVTRLTVDLQRPVPVGELDVEVNVTREGRNIQTAEIFLSSGGKQVVRASALKIRKEALDLPEGAALAEMPLEVTGGRAPFSRTDGFNSAVEMQEAPSGRSPQPHGMSGSISSGRSSMTGDDAADAGGGDGGLLQRVRFAARFRGVDLYQCRPDAAFRAGAGGRVDDAGGEFLDRRGWARARLRGTR
ncbi:MAG: thioesterase family protein [Hyphomonas sp.]